MTDKVDTNLSKTSSLEPNPVCEHTNNQIKESIRASSACGELQIVVDRELTTFDESIDLLKEDYKYLKRSSNFL